MTNNEINTVLAGRNNSINQTIFELLEEQEHIQIEQWPADSLEAKLDGQASGSIDVLIADLLSFSQNIIKAVENISEHEAVKAVLAIHIYRSLKPIKKLIKAGALGYLQQDTDEQQIMTAIEHLHKGKRHIGIKENAGIGENT